MVERTPPESSGAPAISADNQKRLMALDALSYLTDEFARHSDVNRLLEIVILTLSGQFTVTSAFVILQSPDTEDTKPLSRATGKFVGSALLDLIAQSLDGVRLMMEDGRPHTIEGLRRMGVDPDFVNTLETATVRVMVPLIHDNRMVGLIGLGPRVGDKPFGVEEIHLLSTLAGTLTPLMINSVLFGELDRLKTWYLDIINSVEQSVFVFDRKLRLTKVNVSGLDLFMATNDTGHGNIPSNGDEISAVFPDRYFPDWLKKLMWAIPHCGDGEVIKLRCQQNGVECIFHARVVHGAGQSSGGRDLIITLDDVTDQVEQEQRFFDVQRLADQGKMAATITHELNNFLTIIMAGTEMTVIALQDDNVAKALSLLEKVKSKAESMIRFTAGLTDFSRQRKQILEGDLNEIVTDVLSFISVQKRYHGITVNSTLESTLSPLLFDPDQISQVLLNLLNNAADAIAEQERDDGVITVRTRIDGNRTVLEVEDNGPGVPESLQNILLKKKHTTKKDGHGFGLITCKKIMEDHGGSIELVSETGKGTTFIIRLPSLQSPER